MIYVDPRDPCYLPDPEDREPDIFDLADSEHEEGILQDYLDGLEEERKLEKYLSLNQEY